MIDYEFSYYPSDHIMIKILNDYILNSIDMIIDNYNQESLDEEDLFDCFPEWYVNQNGLECIKVLKDIAMYINNSHKYKLNLFERKVIYCLLDKVDSLKEFYKDEFYEIYLLKSKKEVYEEVISEFEDHINDLMMSDGLNIEEARNKAFDYQISTDGLMDVFGVENVDENDAVVIYHGSSQLYNTDRGIEYIASMPQDNIENIKTVLPEPTKKEIDRIIKSGKKRH